MTKKLYEITIAYENNKNGYTSNIRGVTVLAETALEAIEKIELRRGEFVDEIENLGVVEIE